MLAISCALYYQTEDGAANMAAFYAWMLANGKYVSDSLPTGERVIEFAKLWTEYAITTYSSTKEFLYDWYLTIKNLGTEHAHLKKMCEHYNGQILDATGLARDIVNKVGIGKGNELAQICAPFK